MPLRLEDRIRELCAKAVATPEPPRLNEILRQLKDALSEHTRRMRTMVRQSDDPPTKSDYAVPDHDLVDRLQAGRQRLKAAGKRYAGRWPFGQLPHHQKLALKVDTRKSSKGFIQKFAY